MTKADIVANVLGKVNMSKKDAEQAVSEVFDSIIRASAEGDKVSIAGFGVFEVRERAARTGRNPQTGQPVQIAASKGVGFKAGKAYKESL